jgi:hypothetical protein
MVQAGKSGTENNRTAAKINTVVPRKDFILKSFPDFYLGSVKK